MPTIHDTTAATMTVPAMYAVLRLRTDVFVVEQECAYAELDGRDLDPLTRHVWTDDDVGPTSYLRVLRDGSGAPLRIGRVCTRRDARSTGLAALLMDHVLDGMDETVSLNAQAHLTDWYGRFGFRPDGEVFDDDGIPHRRMIRP